MMLSVENGMYINTAHVRTMRGGWTKGDQFNVRCEFTDGTSQTYQADFEDFKRVMDDYSPLLPSPPNYWLLIWLPDANEVERWPVLAWRFDGELGYHRVFTAFTSPEDQDRHTAILCPDGQVVHPGGGWWPNEEAWITEQRKAKLSVVP